MQSPESEDQIALGERFFVKKIIPSNVSLYALCGAVFFPVDQSHVT